MSIHAPQRLPAKPVSPAFAFLFPSAIAICFLGAGLILGTEPRMSIKRTGDRVFQVTGSNHFAGRQFYQKTIDGVTDVVQGNAYRDRRSDSQYEKRKQRKRKHVEFEGTNGTLSWDREQDQLMIEEFMRGTDLSLDMAEKPPTWRMALAWFMTALGGLTFLGAIQSLFRKKPAANGNGQ